MKKDALTESNGLATRQNPLTRENLSVILPAPLQNTEDVSIQALIKTSDSVQEYKGTLNIGKTYTDTECRLNGQLT